MLSAVATLAYDCRRSAYFTDQLYAALTLIDRGMLAPGTRGSMHGEVGQTQFLPKSILNYGTGGNLDKSQHALMSTANFLKAPWLERRRRIPAGPGEFRRHPGLERGLGLSAGDRHHRPADRRALRRRGSRGRAGAPSRFLSAAAKQWPSTRAESRCSAPSPPAAPSAT